jgi:hypothetical protein
LKINFFKVEKFAKVLKNDQNTSFLSQKLGLEKYQPSSPPGGQKVRFLPLFDPINM